MCNLPAWQPDVHAQGFETQVRSNLTVNDCILLNAASYEKSVYKKGSSNCATAQNPLPPTAPGDPRLYGASLNIRW